MITRFALITMVLLLILSMAAPLVGASTLQVIVGGSLKTAEIVATSHTNLVFAYPSTSLVSSALNGFNYSVELSAPNVPPESDAFQAFQHQLRRGFQNITLTNMSVYLSLDAHANTTSLVVTKTVVIQAWATGIFNKTNSRVVGDFGWKNFEVKGNLDVDFDGQTFDINTVGSTILFPFGGDEGLVGFMMHSFGGGPLWSASTINFSALNTPLSQWTRSYNPSTNTTIFSKTVSSTFLYREETSVNGENYTISLSYDPSCSITLPGYAVANGNAVIVQQAPPGSTQRGTAIIVSVAVIAIVVAASVLLRRNTR